MDSVIHLFRDILSGKVYVVTTIISSILIILSSVYLFFALKTRKKVKKQSITGLIPPKDDIIPTPTETQNIIPPMSEPQQNIEQEKTLFEQKIDEVANGDVVMTEETNNTHSVYSGDTINFNNDKEE